jgi:hypothetical protein
MSLSWDGYYVAEVPEEYLPLSESLRVKIDGSSGPSGTLEQTSWHNGLTWVTEDPRQTGVFEPYIGPYLTLLESSPGPDDKIIPVSLNPEENVIINWNSPDSRQIIFPGWNTERLVLVLGILSRRIAMPRASSWRSAPGVRFFGLP